MDIGDVTFETFEGREGERFSIQLADGTVDLTLAAVEKAPGDWGAGEGRTAFSVAFDGSPEQLLPQQIWPLDHEEIGRIELFLVPLGPQEGAMRYEAVFT